MTELPMRIRVLLSFQRAMLGMVTSSLVGVAVSWSESVICARFVYDQPTAVEAELVEEIETEVLADFRDCTTSFELKAVENGEISALAQGEIWVYRRHDG